MASKLDELRISATNLESALKTAQSATEGLMDSLLEGGRSFDAMIEGARQLSISMDRASASIGNMGEAIPLLKPLAGVLQKAIDASSSLLSVTTSLTGAYSGMIGILDATSRPYRRLTRDIFELGARFGATFEQAQTYTEYIMRSARRVSEADYGYINIVELESAMQDLAAARIPISLFNETITSTAGSMDLLSTAVLHAGAMGLEVSEYFSLLGHAILTQGKTAQQAVEQMAEFRDISEDTGLTVTTVAENLQSLASNFSRLGLSADFGRPLLAGFTRTLKDMGLGIENATTLTTDLGDALASLTTDYATAFLTATRGGLEIGGGGALSAGIQLQARMLEAERDVTGEAQADLATELAEGLRETVAGLAGGRIITVGEAARDETLQTAFFTQTKILEDIYGLDQQSSARTLDFLKDLEQATAQGDEEAANKIGEQIQQQIENRVETTDQLDILNTQTAAMLSENLIQTKHLSMMTRLMAEGLQQEATGAQVELLQQVRSGLNDLESASKNTIQQLEEGVFDFGTMKDFLENLNNQVAGAGGPGAVAIRAALEPEDIERLGMTREERTEGGGEFSWDILYTKIDGLVEQLRTIAMNMTGRSPLNAPAVPGSGRGK